MRSLQQFAQTLSKTPCGHHFDAKQGDQVFVQNAYGRWIDKGYTIIGFDPDPNEKDYIYLNWDCYWFGKHPNQIIPESRWQQRTWLARVYSVNAALFHSLNLRRKYSIVSDWDRPGLTDEQLIEHSTEFFRWTEADDRGIFLVHNQMAKFFWDKEIQASDEPEYYDPIATFHTGSTVVLNSEDLATLEQIGLEQTNTPALSKLPHFVEAARNEIANGNIVYYRAF